MRQVLGDAGTAAELAIQRQIDDLLVAVAADVTDALHEKYKTLTGLSQLLQKLGGPQLPQSFQQVFAEPRNAASHKGVEPPRSEARAALDTAIQVVEAPAPHTV